MQFKITGVIEKIFPEQKLTEKFAKKELWLKTEDEYPQVIKFDFINKQIEKLDSVFEGDKVELSFGINGRVKDGKCWNTLSGIYVKVEGKQSAPQKPAFSTAPQSEPIGQDDLPF